jgi:hypothetical protein
VKSLEEVEVEAEPSATALTSMKIKRSKTKEEMEHLKVLANINEIVNDINEKKMKFAASKVRFLQRVSSSYQSEGESSSASCVSTIYD